MCVMTNNDAVAMFRTGTTYNSSTPQNLIIPFIWCLMSISIVLSNIWWHARNAYYDAQDGELLLLMWILSDHLHTLSNKKIMWFFTLNSVFWNCPLFVNEWTTTCIECDRPYPASAMLLGHVQNPVLESQLPNNDGMTPEIYARWNEGFDKKKN